MSSLPFRHSSRRFLVPFGAFPRAHRPSVAFLSARRPSVSPDERANLPSAALRGLPPRSSVNEFL